jgi:hypothetical protein
MIDLYFIIKKAFDENIDYYKIYSGKEIGICMNHETAELVKKIFLSKCEIYYDKNIEKNENKKENYTVGTYTGIPICIDESIKFPYITFKEL